mmetsp:Transcript_21828/g.66932  ORF Transcript_21828/g.66932 Transcript_21828/m.66932 type:complete len:237 (+) Transcript_21828:3140-3850(+)
MGITAGQLAPAIANVLVPHVALAAVCQVESVGCVYVVASVVTTPRPRHREVLVGDEPVEDATVVRDPRVVLVGTAVHARFVRAPSQTLAGGATVCGPVGCRRRRRAATRARRGAHGRRLVRGACRRALRRVSRRLQRRGTTRWLGRGARRRAAGRARRRKLGRARRRRARRVARWVSGWPRSRRGRRRIRGHRRGMVRRMRRRRVGRRLHRRPGRGRPRRSAGRVCGGQRSRGRGG